MSDFLFVRGIDAAATRPLFDAWKSTRKWVRSVGLRDSWEPQALEINRRNAMTFTVGKHKVDLAHLVLLIQERGGRVIHSILHRRPVDRLEEDMGEWAIRHTRDST